MFAGINVFLAILKLILTLAALGLKWVWVGPKTYLCPRTSTCYIIIGRRERIYKLYTTKVYVIFLTAWIIEVCKFFYYIIYMRSILFW